MPRFPLLQSHQPSPFNQIQQRLLWANVLVFGLVLSGFAIALRTTFTYTLRQQQQTQLRALGRSAAAIVEAENGQLEIDSEDLTEAAILTNNQGVQWFTADGQLIDQLGLIHPAETFSPADNHQIRVTQTVTQIPLQALTQTIPFSDEQAGASTSIYVRVSQSLLPYNTTIRQFDQGLGISGLVALGISSLGVLWLNHQAMRPIEANFERLRQFTADASHELRNPIMAITSNAEVALRYPDGMRAEDKATLEAIVSAAEQMAHLTQDLLLLTRLDQHMAVNRVPVDLHQLLTDLVRLYQPQAQTQQIDLQTKLSPNLTLIGHAPHLIQAVTNLLQNALRYTPTGGTVIICSGQTTEGCFVSIQDTGMGIAPDQLPKIFDRFWRADRARSAAAGGSGLGLAIVMAIIQSHGGTIEVRSQLGEGSCFTVRLPAGSSPDRDREKRNYASTG